MLITNIIGWDEEGLYLVLRESRAKARRFRYIKQREVELLSEPYASKIVLLEKLHGLPKNHIINEYRKLDLNTTT